MSDFLFGLMIALSVGPVASMIANYGTRAGTASHVAVALAVLGYGVAGLVRL